MCEVWAGRLVPAACGGDLKFYTVMWTGLCVSNFAVCDGILLCFTLSKWCLGSVISLFKPAWFMFLVLWTLYSVSALAFREVSTKSCGVLFVFGLKPVIFRILKSGRTGRTFSLFSWIGYNGLPEYYCTRYGLESIAVCTVSCSCWGFQTCFAEGKAEYFK